MRRALVIACLACAALAVAAASVTGAIEAAGWCAVAWMLRRRRRGAPWVAALLAVAGGFAAWVRLVTLWVSAIAPRKPAGIEWHTARLGLLMAACVTVLVLTGVEARRARRAARTSRTEEP